MQWTRVGLTIALSMMVAIAIPVASEPHASYTHDELDGQSQSLWAACPSGHISYPTQDDETPDTPNGNGIPPYLALMDNNDTADGTSGHSIAYRAGGVDTALTVYESEALMERQPDWKPDDETSADPGLIGLVFGLTSCEDFYLFAVEDDLIQLYHRNSTGYLLLYTNGHQAGSPATSNALDTVDFSHRYTAVVEGRSVSLGIDGFTVFATDLDAEATDHGVNASDLPTPSGTVGVFAEDNTKVFLQRIRHLPIDDTAPSITIDVPEEGHMYVADIDLGESPLGGSTPIVAGDLTIEYTVSDDLLGIETAWVEADGDILDDSFMYDVDDGTYEWTVETGKLGLLPGEHTIRVHAADWDKNRAWAEITIFVIPTVVGTGSYGGLVSP